MGRTAKAKEARVAARAREQVVQTALERVRQVEAAGAIPSLRAIAQDFGVSYQALLCDDGKGFPVRLHRERNKLVPLSRKKMTLLVGLLSNCLTVLGNNSMRFDIVLRI